jgi:hypothetical protein
LRWECGGDEFVVVVFVIVRGSGVESIARCERLGVESWKHGVRKEVKGGDERWFIIMQSN